MDLSEYKYERGEGRHKHRWKRDEAGFREEHGVLVGKCHRSINEDVAEELLHSGVPEPDWAMDDFVAPSSERHPERIFNVYRGVPYVAVPTTPGSSFHGYPWRGRLPPSVSQELEQRLNNDKEAKRRFKKWMKEHGRS